MDLDSLIAQFDGNPFAISRVMRQLRDTDFGRFQESALRAIASLPESSGIRFLATLIPLSEPVLEIVANPIAFDEPSARRIIEVLRRIDSQAEAKLLRLITSNPGRPLPPPMIDRILDIVDALTEGPRLVPALMQIFRSANPYLRARLSLSIGKHHRNKDWIEDRMRDNDPRVRANTVEANWLQTDETAMTLFNTALRDTHHRVAGNGAVGLYYAGDVRALLVFGELLGSTDPTRQATGVWAVGHVQDTRFQAQVSALADCPDLIVHRSVVLTLGSLKRITEIRGEQPRLQLRLIKAVRRPMLGARWHNHLFLEVKQPQGGAPIHGMKPMNFHIFENGEAVLDYSVRERTSYIKRGTYDIYFTSIEKPDPMGDGKAMPALPPHQLIVVLTEHAFGEHELHAPVPEPEPVPMPEPVPTIDTPPAEPEFKWDGFKQFT